MAALVAGWLILAVTSVAAPSARSADSLVGKLYEGVLNARVIPPPSSAHRPRSHHGKATAILESTGAGTARLILNGTLLKDGDASFMAPGRFQGGDWAGRSDSFALSIGSDGSVTGAGRFQNQPMTFEGAFEDRDLNLIVEITVPVDTQGGLPAGTVFQFQYALRHFPPSSRRAGTGSREDGGCREVVYRLKLTPNLFGGGLSSVRVPECVQ